MKREVKLFYDDNAGYGDSEWSAVVQYRQEGDRYGYGETPFMALEDLAKTLKRVRRRVVD
jgi:hypothetical protein